MAVGHSPEEHGVFTWRRNGIGQDCTTYCILGSLGTISYRLLSWHVSIRA